MTDLSLIPEPKKMATHKTLIDCTRKENRCPTTPKNNIKYKKYRGVKRCWGCRFAYWLGTREPYGPRPLRRTRFITPPKEAS